MKSRYSTEVRWSHVGAVFVATSLSVMGMGLGCGAEKPKPETKSFQATPAGGSFGTDAGWSDASVPPSLTATQACARFMRAVCERKNECGLANDDCAKAATNCPDALFSTGSTRDPEGTWHCAFELRQRSCADVYLSKNPPCVTPGTRKAGESCVAATQCESLACNGSNTSCGTCLQRAAKGADCSNRTNVVCERGLTCEAASNTCVEMTSPDFEDVVSTGVELGKACDARSVCAKGAYCKYGDKGGTCSARAAEGESCQTSAACIEGTYCFQEGATCRKLPGAGQRCGNDVETGNAAWCTDDSYCDNLDSLNQCKPLPAPGEPCAANKLTGTPVLCAESATCDTSATPPTCKALAGPGALCGENEGCQPSLQCVCNDATCTSRICGAIREVGESCSTAGELCNAVSTCTDGTCKANPSQGIFARVCGA